MNDRTLNSVVHASGEATTIALSAPQLKSLLFLIERNDRLRIVIAGQDDVTQTLVVRIDGKTYLLETSGWWD
jgi:hypothetical protein